MHNNTIRIRCIDVHRIESKKTVKILKKILCIIIILKII